MEKKTYNLCFEVLKRIDQAGVLKHLVLVGSWSIYFYKYYFKDEHYSTYLRTRDIDFAVPIPPKIKDSVSISNLIEDLGFVEIYKGKEGYLIHSHPDLSVEFIVPERGRGTNRPYNLAALGTNAQRLRFLDFLIGNTIRVDAEGMNIIVPHPAAFVLHKFLISEKRRKKDKRDRDIEGALRVFEQLMKQGEQNTIKRMFDRMPKKWQKKMYDNLKQIGEDNIAELLIS
ncbi:MAG: hypothetical protein JW734_05425 [Candidatus Omnitrophica bacterium]|nr:hypothetical protein [Candidatus Omnitrophota bacterium]